MTRLDDHHLRAALSALPQWQRDSDTLVRTLEFPDFAAAIQFVMRVADAAEAAGHHPDIDIRWNRVRLALTTHDAGGLTQADLDLAATLDGLAP